MYGPWSSSYKQSACGQSWEEHLPFQTPESSSRNDTAEIPSLGCGRWCAHTPPCTSASLGSAGEGAVSSLLCCPKTCKCRLNALPARQTLLRWPKQAEKHLIPRNLLHLFWSEATVLHTHRGYTTGLHPDDLPACVCMDLQDEGLAYFPPVITGEAGVKGGPFKTRLGSWGIL